jgi:hypothetical protein
MAREDGVEGDDAETRAPAAVETASAEVMEEEVWLGCAVMATRGFGDAIWRF